MKRLLLLNGPNINRLGQREEQIYGSFTLKDIEKKVEQTIEPYGYCLDSFQSNSEGELIDRLHAANDQYEGIIFNPAAYTHTSIALGDAVKAINTPVIEVHISNVYERETFRHQSMIASGCIGQIVGFGMQSYVLAALAFVKQDESFI